MKLGIEKRKGIIHGESSTSNNWMFRGLLENTTRKKITGDVHTVHNGWGLKNGQSKTNCKMSLTKNAYEMWGCTG